VGSVSGRQSTGVVHVRLGALLAAAAMLLMVGMVGRSPRDGRFSNT
jgi:hypothetical protein